MIYGTLEYPKGQSQPPAPMFNAVAGMSASNSINTPFTNQLQRGNGVLTPTSLQIPAGQYNNIFGDPAKNYTKVVMGNFTCQSVAPPAALVNVAPITPS
jgi:hypothetical protein